MRRIEPERCGIAGDRVNCLLKSVKVAAGFGGFVADSFSFAAE
jgi:hypothetical protein